ncbi:helix-turn-helix domain-containing protein [Azohydromonas caseinilytica]|uniref:Helix-turn-helix domain-containing protein n=1 Tax=Azohydromonas caseinilytica TaxID=2728836 RepID=A0A848FH39_9BURK|nr:helix-turn-helix domain-containing protein [Azohydromonas caseinilytica]NML17609.1 helix-turn-helix domain-containing protein [Azohydromonas caseinilytica]
MDRRLEHAQASLRRYAGEYPAHAHGHAQVLVGLQGCLELELDGHAAFVDAASALIVPAGVSHAFLADTPARMLVIDAPPGGALQRVRRFVPPPHWKAQPPDVLDAEAAIAAVGGTATLLQRRRIDLMVLEAAVAAAPAQDWSTPRLAGLCFLSPQRFHARFTELSGLTPAAWVRRCRLDAAERLIRAGLSLDAAALQVGYATASALAFALRRERGYGARAVRARRNLQT